MRGGITARTYLNLMKENLPAIIGDDSIFIQDNASEYSAGKAYEGFSDHFFKNGGLMDFWTMD